MLGAQAKERGAEEPETLHLLGVKRKGRDERSLFRLRKKETVAKLRLTPCG